MKLRCAAVAAGLLWASAGSLAHADDSTPVPVSTQPPVTEPTSPPPVEVPTQPPAEVPTVSSDVPVGVAQEHSTPIVRVGEPAPGATEAAPAGSSQYDTGAASVPPGAINPNGNLNGRSDAAVSGASSNANGSSPGNGTTSGISLPPVAASGDPSADGSIGFTYDTKSAQAPGELTCSGKDSTRPASPFLVAPYAGWTEVNSFLDHDSPDYSVDGTIIIANGLQANASDGQESDMFPAYWSPELRQYVNYDGHNGYDFAISYQPVLAAGAGTISFAGWTDSGYGNMVLINHHNGYTTLYGHLSQLQVKKGDRVAAGEEIGISGSTGRSSGPHLHFSVFHDCQVTDPYGWTGRGTDPLNSFDGERSQYLWLPGHDPLVLNPPVHWPAYPAGLKLDIAHLTSLGAANRMVPAADRLLLLRLPSTPHGQSVQPAVALARTESSMTQEAEALTPELQGLRDAGYVDAFQVLPSAAAVWVRGTASAAQLEALPGVASLSGVRPIDVEAAQSGLAHSVLVQMGQQPAPSLWPAGFRSALQTWRPVTTTVIGQALVAGAALPGQKVTLSLQRGHKYVATAEAFGDADNGGFAATLNAASGRSVAVQPGDVLHLASGTRVANVRISGLSVRARNDNIVGWAGANTTVPVVVTDAAGSLLWHAVSAANRSGDFVLKLPFHLASGSQAVILGADAAGNQQAAAASMPGATIDLTSSRVSGWAVGNGPYLQVRRDGRVLETRPLHAAADGAFALNLDTRRTPHGLLPGDTVSIGSRWHRRTTDVPRLSVQLTRGSRRVVVRGPAGARVQLTVSRPSAVTWTALLRLSKAKMGSVTIPAAAAPGTSATALADLGNGMAASASEHLRSLQLYLGTGELRGVAPPESAVDVAVLSAKGRTIGSTVGASDEVTGEVDQHLLDVLGRNARPSNARYVALGTGAQRTTIGIPSLRVSLSKGGALRAQAPARASVDLELVYTTRTVRWTRVVSPTGALSLNLPHPSDLLKVLVTVPVTPELSVVRTASLARQRSHPPKGRARSSPHRRKS